MYFGLWLHCAPLPPCGWWLAFLTGFAAPRQSPPPLKLVAVDGRRIA